MGEIKERITARCEFINKFLNDLPVIQVGKWAQFYYSRTQLKIVTGQIFRCNFILASNYFSQISLILICCQPSFIISIIFEKIILFCELNAFQSIFNKLRFEFVAVLFVFSIRTVLILISPWSR